MRDVRQKHGSENIMAVDNGLNAALEPVIAEASFNGEERLLNIRPLLFTEEGMKQHPFLHMTQRINVLDFLMVFIVSAPFFTDSLVKTEHISDLLQGVLGQFLIIKITDRLFCFAFVLAVFDQL